VTQLRPVVEEIEALGFTLAIIGNGTPFFARAFREDMQLAAPVFVDEKLEAYRAAGLKRGFFQTLNLRAIPGSVAAYLRGARQDALKGDPWQQGGILVVRQGGEVAFRQVSRWPGDHVEIPELLDRLRASRAAA
jgi:hypothetical protein